MTAPTYTVGGNTYNDVGGAIAALDTASGGAIDVNNTSALAAPTATGNDATAISPGAVASGTDSFAAGKNAAATAAGATAIGAGSTASNVGSVALGDGAKSTGVNSVAIGTGSNDGGLTDVVSIGSVGNERTLINVAPGAISATSTDAVNGSQIFANQASVATILGGGAAVLPDGTISAPTYTIGGTAYNNVGGALTALDTAVSGGGGIKYFHTNSTLADATADRHQQRRNRTGLDLDRRERRFDRQRRGGNEQG